MDTNIFNKIDKSQLKKIDVNHIEVINKDEEKETKPGIGPAIHNYINLNQFDVRLDTPSELFNNVISVTKPLYNVRKEKYVSHKIMVGFEVIHAVHFFGKPSRYDNFYTDEDIISMVNEFNEAKHPYMEVYEYDQNGDTKIKTTYTAPRIYRLDFSTFDKKMTDKKFYVAEIHFNNMTQEHVVYTEEETEDKER